MTRVPASLVGAAALLALAACTDSATKVTAPSGLQPVFNNSPELNSPKYSHVMKLKGPGEIDAAQAQKDAQDEANDAKTGGAHKAPGTGINYHGGAILVTTNIAAVYWATSPIFAFGPAAGTSSTDNSGDHSLVGDFLRGLGGSPYFNINTTYYMGSTAPFTYVQNSVTYTQYWANNTNVPNPTLKTTITDAQMIAMLQSGFDNGKLVYDPNTLYAIFTQGTTNLGGGFGTQYCAYHANATVTINGVARNIFYAAMPYDYQYPGGCTSGYATDDGDKGAATEVNTLAHELEETTTDGLLDAWWDNRGMENADKCAWTWGTTQTSANGGKYNMIVGSPTAHKVLIQQNWKNVSGGGCALHL
jgi:hypothetical protein